MKLELSYDEVSTVCRALLLKAQEAAGNALECQILGSEDAGLWQESAETYKKALDTVEAQREQTVKKYEQAVAALQEEANV